MRDNVEFDSKTWKRIQAYWLSHTTRETCNHFNLDYQQMVELREGLAGVTLIDEKTTPGALSPDCKERM